jgi:hypothetical protein
MTIAGQTFTVNQAGGSGGGGGGELLSNAGFESWSGGLPTSWTKHPTTTVTQSTTTHGGSFSCQVQNPDWKGVTQTLTGSKPSGTTLTATAWVKWVAGSSTSPYIQLVITYSDGTPPDYVGALNVSFTTNGWYQLSKVFTVAHPVSSVDLNVLNASGVAQTFLVDDASLTDGGGCAPSVCGTSGDLLSNSDMETWSGGMPTSWTKPGASTVTQSTSAHGGSRSCQVQTPDWEGIMQTVAMTKPSGTTLTGTAWVKWVAGATTSPFLQLVITYSDGNPTDYVGAASASFTTTGWYQLTRAFTVTHPVSSTDLKVVNNSGTSETWLVDDASLTAQ